MQLNYHVYFKTENSHISLKTKFVSWFKYLQVTDMHIVSETILIFQFHHRVLIFLWYPAKEEEKIILKTSILLNCTIFFSKKWKNHTLIVFASREMSTLDPLRRCKADRHSFSRPFFACHIYITSYLKYIKEEKNISQPDYDLLNLWKQPICKYKHTYQPSWRLGNEKQTKNVEHTWHQTWKHTNIMSNWPL